MISLNVNEANNFTPLRKYRLELGLLGKDVAAAIGINPSSLYHYETGFRKPNDDIAYRLIHFFNKKGKKLKLEHLRPEKIK